MLLKPHPLSQAQSVESPPRRAKRDQSVVQDNTYRLMSLPQIAAVLTVNSSVAYEAPYFNKRVHTLAPLPSPRLAGMADEPDINAASIDDQVLSVDFWRRVWLRIQRSASLTARACRRR